MEEMLTVGAVAYAADRILRTCLVGRGLTGREPVGAGKKVVVSLVRIDFRGGWEGGAGRRRGNGTSKALMIGV